MRIKSIKAFWLADSELNKTVGVKIKTDKGEFFGSAPQGTSDGIYEAVAVPVDKAISNIQNIIPELMKLDPSDLKGLDGLLRKKGGKQMRMFGTNASVPLSSAWTKMSASACGLATEEYLSKLLGTTPKMPVPSFNIINGGLHGAVDKNGNPYNPIQELMLVPASASSFAEAYETAMKVFGNLRKVSGESLVGKEGGFSPARPLKESIEFVRKAVVKSGFKTKDFRLALDSAASEFFSDGKYIPVSGGKPLDTDGMISFYKTLRKDSPIEIFLIEDPLDQDDFEGFAKAKKDLDALIIGDDLYVTQLDRVKKGFRLGSTGGTLIKINQNGTVSGTLDVVKFGLENGLVNMISHRSKRAPNDFINAYLSVAAGQMLKHGSSRGERVEAYNKLLEIERESKESGNGIPYAGKDFFS